MAVPDQIPVTTHTGNGVTTVFSYQYLLTNAEDVSVSLDGVVKNLGVDYSVTGLRDQSGGSVTFVSPPAAGVAVVIERSIALMRDTEYQYAGDFQSPTVNDDFDRLWMAMQDSGLRLLRSLRFPLGDLTDGTLPRAADRAQKLLSFDANGMPVVVALAAQSATALQSVLATADGAWMIGVQQSIPGAVPRTVASMLMDRDPSLSDFGQGDGTTTDSQAYAAAEASTSDRIYLASDANVTGSAPTKLYYGPGKLVLNGTARGRRLAVVDALPSRGTGEGIYYGGDLSHVQPEEFAIESSVNRTSVSTPYYDYPLIQHFNRSTFKSGHSGYDARILSGGVAGTNNVFVNDTSPFTLGQVVLVSPYTPQEETATISAINTGTGLVSFQLPLAHTHPAGGVHSLSSGKRTHTSIYQTEMSVEGVRTGGDFIARNTRIAANPTHNVGRDHCFDRTTIGFDGGDAFGLGDGVYIAGTEHHYYDKGVGPAADIFVIDITKSFIRENDTGARGAVWLGTLYKSEGTKYANATHVITGKWKRGLDTALADFGTDQAALSHGFGQRHYWGSTSNPDIDGYRFWSDTLGSVYTKGDQDGTSVYWEVNAGGAAGLRVRPTGVTVGGTLTVSQDVQVALGNRVILSPNTYLISDGTHTYLINNGGTPKQLD